MSPYGEPSMPKNDQQCKEDSKDNKATDPRMRNQAIVSGVAAAFGVPGNAGNWIVAVAVRSRRHLVRGGREPRLTDSYDEFPPR
jgi:hypothetical protein